MFWDVFYRFCEMEGTSPNAVAKKLGISSASVTKWKNGAIPHGKTLRTIAEYFGVSVDFMLTGKHETINAPPMNEKGVKIPVLGRVAAGIPIEAIEDIVDYEEIPASLARLGDYFGLVIHGHSMEPRMKEGDVIIVRKQDYAESGDIVIVLINGTDATCKLLKKTSNGISLISYNSVYGPMNFTPEEIENLPVRIIGKAVELRAKL